MIDLAWRILASLGLLALAGATIFGAAALVYVLAYAAHLGWSAA